jgi:hypothetical protein
MDEVGGARLPQIYRGRVIPLNGAVSFFGVKDDPQRFMTMEWWPPRPDATAKLHALEAHGVILTGNAHNGTVVGPVGACFIPETEEFRDLERQRDAAPRGETLDQRLAVMGKARGKELEQNIGRVSGGDLRQRLAGLCNPDALARTIKVLQHAIAEARRGAHRSYYVVRALE